MKLSDVLIVQTPIPDLVELRYQRKVGGKWYTVGDCINKADLRNAVYVAGVLERMQHAFWELERGLQPEHVTGGTDV